MADIHYGPMFMSAARKYEVQRTNHFRVVFGIDDQETVELAVDSISLPNISNETVELSYGNSKVKVAGQATFDDVSLTVKDFIEADVEMILYKWRKQVYNPETDTVGWASNYKHDGIVYQYGPDGTVVRKWKLIGCWPTNMDVGEMSYDSSDRKSITMTVSIDKAYPVRD